MACNELPLMQQSTNTCAFHRLTADAQNKLGNKKSLHFAAGALGSWRAGGLLFAHAKRALLQTDSFIT